MGEAIRKIPTRTSIIDPVGQIMCLYAHFFGSEFNCD